MVEATSVHMFKAALQRLPHGAITSWKQLPAPRGHLTTGRLASQVKHSKCGLVLSCTILCSTTFCRLSNDSQRRITQRIDIYIDGAAYRLHGQKLAGRAFSREWNDVDETASAAAAGNRFHSGMVPRQLKCLRDN